MQAPGDTFFIQHIEDVLRHGQRVRGDKVEAVAAEFGQRLGQGVDGTAILQIADHRHVEVFEAALGLLDGEQVEQGLGRVLVSAVASVQYRHAAGEFGRQARGALLRMTHHDGVNVGADDGDGIRQGFPFFAQRGIGAVRKADHAGAQAVHRGFKRETGTGGGFKETAGDNLMLQQLGLRIGFQLCRRRQHQFEVFAAEIVYGNDMFLI